MIRETEINFISRPPYAKHLDSSIGSISAYPFTIVRGIKCLSIALLLSTLTPTSILTDAISEPFNESTVWMEMEGGWAGYRNGRQVY